MSRAKFEDLKDAYALGALTPSEEQEFEAYMRENPELQPEVDELSGIVSLLALSPADREPPKTLRKNLLKTIESEAGSASGTERRRRRSRGFGGVLASLPGYLRVGPVALGAAGLLVVGLFSWNVLLQGQLETLRGDNSSLQAQVEDLGTSDNDSGATNRVLAMDAQGNMSGVQAEVLSYEDGRAVLVADNMPDISEGETFQIWVVSDGEASPSGLFEQREASDGSPVAAYVDHSLEGADAIAVTVEPEGGSEQPTSDPELVTSL